MLKRKNEGMENKMSVETTLHSLTKYLEETCNWYIHA